MEERPRESLAGFVGRISSGAGPLKCARVSVFVYVYVCASKPTNGE